VFRNYSKKQQATTFEGVLNIRCKVPEMDYVTVDDQPGLGQHCHRPVLKTTDPGHSCSRWTYYIHLYSASPEL